MPRAARLRRAGRGGCTYALAVDEDHTWARRSVLAAAAVGLAGVVTAWDDGPVEEAGLVPTRHLDRSPRWRLARPRLGTPRGLVVALHGHGGDADTAFDLGLGKEVERTRLAVVSVDGGDSYWHARRDGSDSGAMVRDELLPMALGLAGLPTDVPVVLLGWSMGGYGALRIACDLGPGRVRGVVAVSAALWRRASQTPAGAYDDRADFERNSVLEHIDTLARIPVRIDCGTSDPFVAANRFLASELVGAAARFTPGGHDESYWRAQAPGEMTWAAAKA